MMRTFGAHCVQTGKLYDFDERIRRIDALTKEDVLSASKYVFNFDKAAASIVAEDVSTDILAILQNR